MVAGTSIVRAWPLLCDRAQRVVGREARMDGDRRTEMQRRRGLDVHAADMEQRQHRQHMIVGGHGVHVLAHHAVPSSASCVSTAPFGRPVVPAV